MCCTERLRHLHVCCQILNMCLVFLALLMPSPQAGNDFLPFVPSLDLYDYPSSLDLLLTAYKACLPDLGSGITQVGVRPRSHTFFTLFLLWAKWWSQEAPREGSNLARPLEIPCLGFCTLERTFTLGVFLRRQGFPTWFTHVIYAAAALAGDDSPGR